MKYVVEKLIKFVGPMKCVVEYELRKKLVLRNGG